MEEIFRAALIRRKTGRPRLGSILKLLFWLGVMTGCTMVQQRGESQAIRFEFGVIGDQQYTVEDEEKFPNLIDALNEANIAFVVHVGDIEPDPRPYNINPRAFKSAPWRTCKSASIFSQCATFLMGWFACPINCSNWSVARSSR